MWSTLAKIGDFEKGEFRVTHTPIAILVACRAPSDGPQTHWKAKAHEQTVQEAEDARREFEALRLGLHVELDHLREENTTLKGRVASLEAGEK